MINKLSTLSEPPQFPLKTVQGNRSMIVVRVPIKKPSSSEARQRIDILTKYFPSHIINYGNRVYQSPQAAACTLEELLAMERWKQIIEQQQSTNKEVL